MYPQVIIDLINTLNYHTKLYDEGHPEISDQDWDKLYFSLVDWEKKHGIYHPDSPTQKVNYQVVNELKKVKQKMKEYGFSLTYINKAIFNLRFNIYKKSNDPLIINLDTYIENTPLEVLEKVSEDNIKNDRDNRIIEKGNYEPYQFEEEDLEEDDYYFEDDLD